MEPALALLLVAAAVGSPSAERNERQASLPSLLAEFRALSPEAREERPEWSVVQALEAEVALSGDPDLVRTRWAAAIGAPAEAAEPLLLAVLLQERLWPLWRDRGPVDLGRIQDALGRAFALAPESEVVNEAVGRHFGFWGDKMDDARARLAAITPPSARVSRLALALAAVARGRLTQAMLLEALAAEPRSVALHAAIASAWAPSPLALGLREVAARRVDDADRTLEPAVRGALASAWVGGLLEVGLAEGAIAAFDSLPGPVRDRLLDGPAEAIVATVDGLPFRGRIEPLADGLAAARLVAGDHSEAARLFDRASRLPPVGGKQAARRNLLERALHDGDDPFPLLADLLAGENWDALGVAAVWSRLAAGFARREDYGVAAPELLRPALLAAKSGASYGMQHLASLEAAAPEAAAAARAYAVRLGALAARLDGEDEGAGEEGGAPDASAQVLRAYLATAPGAPFIVPGAPPDTVAGPKRAEAGVEAAGEVRVDLPSGFEPIRAQPLEGRGVAVVAVSRDACWGCDPGGYWLFLVRDAEPQILRPFYLGLHAGEGPVPRTRGARRLLADGEVRVELEESQLYTSSLSELGRDRDGDGLTDLLEERLLFTDAANDDTDGDGQPDLDDPLPQVPWRPRPDDPRGQALEAVLACLVEPAPDILYPASAASDRKPDPRCERFPSPHRPGSGPVFLVAHRGDLGSFVPRRRVIVLEESESAALGERWGWGHTAPLRIRLLVLDRLGRAGVALWSAGSERGAVGMEWSDGAWRVRLLHYVVS